MRKTKIYKAQLQSNSKHTIDDGPIASDPELGTPKAYEVFLYFSVPDHRSSFFDACINLKQYLDSNNYIIEHNGEQVEIQEIVRVEIVGDGVQVDGVPPTITEDQMKMWNY